MKKVRAAVSFGLIASAMACFTTAVRVGAASPTAGTVSPASTSISWRGTAVGGTSNGESTCVEGVNCDTFTLTVSGTPADWTGKQINVAIAWTVLANDYDLFIHKGSNAGPVITSSTHGAPGTVESASINPAIDGTGVFTVHVTYFTGSSADNYNGVARVVTANATPPPAPPRSTDWTINYHGQCCEGNLAAAGRSTYVLLPVLVTGNKIERSDDGGKKWTEKYPPVGASVPFGIEGDMQAFGDDVIFFGTELGDAVTARSSDRGETFTIVHNPVASAGNDQAWAYLGPLAGLRPGGALPTDKPYVLAGWFRIGSAVAFSFDGGLTYPIQTPLAGDDGSGPLHVVCRNNAHAPNEIGDKRIANASFAKHKAGRHGTWGTDKKFYWTEPADGAAPGTRDLYVCSTNDFGTSWSGVKHPVAAGPGSDFVVSHSAFDNKGTLYVLHGNKLYVSFNQGESMAFVHTLPRYGNALKSDSGADQFFVVDNGTIHIALLEAAGGGKSRVYYLRGLNADTASPTWDEEFVDEVGDVRLDFMQIAIDGNGIPTISYTTPTKQVTTASRSAPMPINAPPSRLLNISTRGRVQTGDNVMIGGFIVQGTQPRQVIIRAIGPSLGLPGKMDDPMLELYQQGNSTPIATNDDWKSDQAAVQATGLAPTNDRESAIVRTLDPGAYTAIVRGKNDTSGIALVEAYDLGSDRTSILANLSTRGFVDTGDNVLIAGFIAGPPNSDATKVVVRGIGPSLKPRLANALADTTIELRDVNGSLLDSNDDWQQAAGAAQIQSAGLAPSDAKESALLAPSVTPGAYTAILRGKSSTTGLGLVELYNLP